MWRRRPGAASSYPGWVDEETVEFAHTLFEMAREGDAEQLAAYLDAGIPVDLTNAKGDTLLLLAAYAPHPDVVGALLDRGADPNRVNDRGQTALAAAVFRSSAEGVELLLAAGADPGCGNPDALATASFFDLPEMVALLTRPTP